MSSPNQPPDSVLSLSFASRDREPAPTHLETEVVRLFDELRTSVLRYLLSLGISVQDGEETAQEVFLALFQHLQHGKPRSNLRGWVFQVAHNLGLKLRAGNRRELQTIISASGAVIQNHADPAPDPEQQFVDSQRMERLRAVVQALSAQDRCCLALRAEGLRYREIARVLGISLGSVSICLERSLDRLTRADGR